MSIFLCFTTLSTISIVQIFFKFILPNSPISYFATSLRFIRDIRAFLLSSDLFRRLRVLRQLSLRTREEARIISFDDIEGFTGKESTTRKAARLYCKEMCRQIFLLEINRVYLPFYAWRTAMIPRISEKLISYDPLSWKLELLMEILIHLADDFRKKFIKLITIILHRKMSDYF